VATGKTLRLSLRLEGPLVEDSRLPLSELSRVASQLRVMLRDVAIVLVERGPSGRGGRAGKFIEEATDLQVVGSPRAGSFVLELEAPPQAPPAQEALAIDPGENLSERSVKALIEGLDQLDERSESLPPGFDRGVLRAVQPYKTTLDRGVSAIVLETTTTKERVRTARIDAHKVEVARKLIKKPVKAHAVAEGRLEMVDFATLVCRIDRAPLPSVTCVFQEADRDRVQESIRKFVRVAGEGEFPPDDLYPTRIRVESIEILYEPLMLEGETFWEEKDVSKLAEEQGVSPFRLSDDFESDPYRDDDEAAALIRAIRGDR
jgi:hypothetical protein